jgi:CRP/FNR family transcriptional regulator, cyclic AMP receptor protein
VDWELLAGVPEGDSRRFLSIARRRKFSRGEVVFHEGDPGDALHLIAKGRFAVRAGTAMGDSTMISVVGPGQFFGELALVEEERRQATLSALEPAETLSVLRDEFLKLRDEHPSVERVLVTVLAQDVRVTSRLLVEALYYPADLRVLRRLVQIAEVWGDVEPGLVLPLTQDDIADLAGTTRPTANRVLRKVEEDGLVKLGRGRIELLDPSGLNARARQR